MNNFLFKAKKIKTFDDIEEDSFVYIKHEFPSLTDIYKVKEVDNKIRILYIYSPNTFLNVLHEEELYVNKIKIYNLPKKFYPHLYI